MHRQDLQTNSVSTETESSPVSAHSSPNKSNKTSICDALLADTPGELTFAINSELTKNVLTVSGLRE